MILPKGRYGVTLSVDELDTEPSNSKEEFYQIFFSNAYVSGDVMMCHWGVTEEPTLGDRRLS